MTTLKYGIQRSILFSLQHVTKRHTKSLTIEKVVCNYECVCMYVCVCIYIYIYLFIYLFIYLLNICYKISENLNSWNRKIKLGYKFGSQIVPKTYHKAVWESRCSTYDYLSSEAFKYIERYIIRILRRGTSAV